MAGDGTDGGAEQRVARLVVERGGGRRSSQQQGRQQCSAGQFRDSHEISRCRMNGERRWSVTRALSTPIGPDFARIRVPAPPLTVFTFACPESRFVQVSFRDWKPILALSIALVAWAIGPVVFAVIRFKLPAVRTQRSGCAVSETQLGRETRRTTTKEIACS